MRVAGVAEEPTRRASGARVRPIAGYAWSIPGLVVVALMLLWAVHDGGYDADTWYWGALLVLGLLATVVTARGWRAIRLSRPAKVALVAFALYVAWSYLSISGPPRPGTRSPAATERSYTSWCSPRCWCCPGRFAER